MRTFLGKLAVLLLMLATVPVRAASTQVSLLLEADTARHGDTVVAGIRLHVAPHWHTYWRNPGGSGIPTRVNWQLPPGITAGEIQWPIPEKLPAEELTTYIYPGDVVLLVPLRIAGNAPPGPMTLKASVSWLECEKQCVPGNADVQATLTIGSETKASADAATIATWQKKLPLSEAALAERGKLVKGAPAGTNADFAAHASWEKTGADSRPLVISWPAVGDSDFDFYPYSSDKYDVELTTENLPADSGRVRIRKTIKKLEGDWPTKIPGLLVQKSDGVRTGYEVDLAIDQPRRAEGKSSQSLALMLLFAFLGGTILNVMPCVLPVVSLKILGFVNQSRTLPGEARKLGLIYAAGVVVSFLALAAVVIVVKQLGHAASWGMQFQNPQFVLLLTVLVSLVALNLFGVFEFNLSGRIMGSAGDLASREGLLGAFLNGALATVLATPCTAPFLAPALGFAFAQPAVIIVLIFLAVALGLAAPYVVLSWRPEWLYVLPKPGAWMEKFKIAMGFPMLATAIWLFTLATPNFGEDGDLWLGMFLVLVALAAWIWGQFVQRGRTRRGLAMAASAGIFIASYALLLEGQLNWRDPFVPAKGSLKTSENGIDWQPWSPEAIDAARASGRPVLVDFTAKWCATCQLNKKTSIEIPSVRKKLKEINAVALIENSYEKGPTVVAELNRYERAGVPLVLVYPKNSNAPPEVLPALLTPNTVLDALDRAAAN